MKGYKYIFLDFDGTIADTMNESYDIYTQLVDEFKLNKLSYKECLKLRELNSREALKKIGLKSSLQTLLFFYKAKRKQNKMMNKIKPFYNFIKLLESLKDSYHFVICTSNLKKNVIKFLRNNHINFIDDILSCRAIFSKEKKILKYIKKQEIDITKALYIGDETRDIESCKRINLDIAAVCWGYHEKDNLIRFFPEYLVEDTSDIKKILSI